MKTYKRVTVPIPNTMDDAIKSLRSKNKYNACTYSELVRRLLVIGLTKEGKVVTDESHIRKYEVIADED